MERTRLESCRIVFSAFSPIGVARDGRKRPMRNTTDRLGRKLELVRWISSIAIFAIPSFFFVSYMFRPPDELVDSASNNTSWPIAITLVVESALLCPALAWFFLFPRVIAFFRDREWEYW